MAHVEAKFLQQVADIVGITRETVLQYSCEAGILGNWLKALK